MFPWLGIKQQAYAEYKMPPLKLDITVNGKTTQLGSTNSSGSITTGNSNIVLNT
jgi:hypothetical protein